MNRPEPAALAPALLLQRVAEELSTCQQILRRVEHAVQLILATGAPTANLGPWQKNMQDLDLLDQSLGDLGLCLRAAREDNALKQADALDAIKVLGPLRLADIRHRLNGRPAPEDRADQIEIF